MGVDKSELEIDGVGIAERICSELTTRAIPVTVLGHKPIDGCKHIPDKEEFQGPLLALSRFHPSRQFCFVSSCDMPGFDGSVVELFRDQIESFEAAIPMLNDRLQPLCALYAVTAWPPLLNLAEGGERRIMRWVDDVCIKVIGEEALLAAGIETWACMNVNTGEEMNEFLQRRSTRR